MRRLKDEKGFTLVELLVAIAIMSIIVPVVGGAIFVGLKTADDANDRLVVSHDAQIAAAYFPQDAASASSVVISGPTGLCGTGTNLVVSFQWPQVTSTGSSITTTTAIATYWDEPPSNGHGLLVRSFCLGGASPNVSTTVTVGHYVVSASVACSTACSASPSQVTLTVADCYFFGTGTNCVKGTNYLFTVFGTRRTS